MLCYVNKKPICSNFKEDAHLNKMSVEKGLNVFVKCHA